MLKQENLEITRRSNQLNVTYRWRNPLAYGLTLFALIWNGALVFFVVAGAGFSIGIHLLIGLLIGYYALTLFVNKTTITVNSHELQVEHGPLTSFSRNRTVRSSEVEQLYLKRSGTIKSGNKVTQLYSLLLRTNNEEEHKLIGGIPDMALGKEVERAIEEYLDIKDAPVAEKFELPDLGMLKKFIPERVRQEMNEASREARHRSLPSMDHPTEDMPQEHDQGHEEHLSYDFALCHAPIGATFQVKDAPYQLSERLQIEWTSVEDDAEVKETRILRTAPLGDGPRRQFYAEKDGNQWAYYEERLLDAGERESLGFVSVEAPSSLRNGEQRYYVLFNRRGILKAGQSEVPVEQWTYFCSRAATRFRALQLSGGRWTVAIQEPFDSSYLEAMG